MMQEIRQCANDIRTLFNRLRFVINRGRTTTAIIDSGSVRTVQVSFGYNQSRDAMPLVQQFGLASNPPVGCDVVAVAIAGDRANSAIVGTNHQSYAIKDLGNGNTCIYDANGNTITLSSTGIKLSSPVAIEFDAPTIRIHATTILKLDAGGTGQTLQPGAITNYTQGITPTNLPPDPPEIP